MKMIQSLALYLSFHIHKLSCLVFLFILGIWSLSLILNTGFPIEASEYYLHPESYYVSYFEQSLFLMGILNAAMVSFLVGAEVHSMSLFDPMFVPSMGRARVVITKLLANLFILIGMVTFEILLLYLVAVSIFPSYRIPATATQLVGICILPLLALFLLGELLSLLINSYFIPVLIFIMHLFLNILLKQENVKVLQTFLISVSINANGEAELQGNIYIFGGICLLLGIGNLLLFQKKDICC